MAHRSPARWLAPIALVLFFLLLIAVVGSSSDSGGGSGTEAAAPNATAAPEGDEPAGKEDDGGDEAGGGRKFYVVKLGDTPSQIADENGLTLEELEELNPDLDPQLMQTGDRIRLRK